MTRKVTINTWRGQRSMELASALTMDDVTPDDLSATLGNLLEALVVKGVLSLDEAGRIVGEYGIEWGTEET